MTRLFIEYEHGLRPATDAEVVAAVGIIRKDRYLDLKAQLQSGQEQMARMALDPFLTERDKLKRQMELVLVESEMRAIAGVTGDGR